MKAQVLDCECGVVQLAEIVIASDSGIGSGSDIDDGQPRGREEGEVQIACGDRAGSIAGYHDLPVLAVGETVGSDGEFVLDEVTAAARVGKAGIDCEPFAFTGKGPEPAPRVTAIRLGAVE